MRLLQLPWAQIKHKPLNAILPILLFGLGIGLLLFIARVDDRLDKTIKNNIADVDGVIGAKGSPLQLVLSSLYHADNPTGNIVLKDIKPYLNKRHPIIKDALPISSGDNYRGFRIIGTEDKIVDWYSATLASGQMFSKTMDVVVGAQAAAEISLKIGDTFSSTHGLEADSDHVHDDEFKVVGILHPTGTIIDRLLLTPVSSYWYTHDHDHAAHEDESGHDHKDHDHDHSSHEGHDHGDHDHHDHDHDHDHSEHDGHEHDHEHHDHHDHSEHHHDDHSHDDHSHDDHSHEHHDDEGHDHDGDSEDVYAPDWTQADEDKTITALLLRYRSMNHMALNFVRTVNENTSLQAAAPNIEIGRLYALTGNTMRIIKYLSYLILGVSALSLFIALYTVLKSRLKELALLRAQGASPMQLFTLVVMEGLMVAVLGVLLGIFISRIFETVLDAKMQNIAPTAFWIIQEGPIIIGAIVIAILAALIPALRARNVEVADYL